MLKRATAVHRGERKPVRSPKAKTCGREVSRSPVRCRGDFPFAKSENLDAAGISLFKAILLPDQSHIDGGEALFLGTEHDGIEFHIRELTPVAQKEI
jgi:hypothetical protein